MDMLKLLVSLGLPAAFVGMVVIALVLKSINKTVSTWAAWIAVGLVAVFGIGELVNALRGADITLKVEPSSIYAFTPEGQPVDLRITATRRTSVVASMNVPKQAEDVYASRPLSLESTEKGLLVKHQGNPVGVLTRDRLRDMGWRPSEEMEPVSEVEAKYWYTNRVHAGQTQRLGESRYGVLSIHAKGFTSSGEAVVTLILEGHEGPLPSVLKVRNKSLGTQSYSGIPEFYIALREADFAADPPWAAFSVFSIQ